MFALGLELCSQMISINSFFDRRLQKRLCSNIESYFQMFWMYGSALELMSIQMFLRNCGLGSGCCAVIALVLFHGSICYTITKYS